MQSADLTLRLPEWMQLPTPAYVDGSTVLREEVLSWRAYPDEGVISFLSLVVGDLAVARRAAEDVEPVRSFDVTVVDADTFYAYVEMDLREADTTLLAPLQDRGLVVVPPVTYTDEATVHVTVLGEETALSGLLEAFPDDLAVTVERVSDHQRRPGSLASRLTARQFEALETAREVGYYDVPRTGDLATVADELACSKSAASTLLRNAESQLVDAALPG